MGRYNKVFFLFIIILLAGFSGISAEQSRILIRSAHSSPAASLQNIPETSYIASVGTNGRILVLDAEENRTIHDFYSCDGTIIETAINGSSPEIAVVYRKNNSYFLTVWDWNREIEIFSTDLEQKPILLSFSDDGTYLFVSRMTPPYLIVYKSSNGEISSDFESIRDSFLYLNIDKGGKNLTGYTSGGSLYTWRNFTSPGSTPFISNTIPEMEQLIYFTDGSPSFVGVYRDQLLLIDAEKGTDLHSYTQKNIIKIALSESKKELSVISGSGKDYYLDFFTIEGGLISPSIDRNRQKIPTESQPLSLEVYKETVYIGCRNGEILTFNAVQSQWKPLSFTPVMNISDFSLSKNLLCMISNDSIWAMQSLFFESEDPAIPQFQKNNQTSLRYPLMQPDGILSLDSSNILLYKNNPTQDNSLIVYNVFKGRIRGSLSYTEEILDVIVTDRNFIVIRYDRDIDKTAISVVNIDTMTPLMNFYLPPNYKAAALKDQELLVALNSYQDSEGGFLLHYDMKNQQEIQVINTNFSAIESLVYSNKLDTFYVYGKKQSTGSGDRTHQIYMYPGDDLLKNVALIPACIETVDSELHMDDLYGQIYQLESPYSIIRTSSNGNRKTVMKTRQSIKKIAVKKNYLYLLMEDGSLRGYNFSQKDKMERFTLTIFKDNEWIINPGNGQWIIPSQGVKLNPKNYISVFKKE